MKLSELAEIKMGLEIPPHLLKKEKKSEGTYIHCIQAIDFFEGSSYYINQKEIKSIKDFSKRSFLFYGDYIFYKRGQDFKMLRYINASGQTIPTNGIVVVTADFNIIKEFLGFEKNRKYFCNELKKIESTKGKLTIENIGEIDVWTDDIKELENADMAEQIGIRKPVNIKETPIRITQKSLPFDKLIKRIKHNELLLDTEFQRRPGLWDLPTKSRLIESLIIKLPIPAFYFDGSDDDKWLVIDGLQRLSAVNDFVNNRFSLIELDYLPELEEKKFSQLDRIHQRNIEEFEIFACIIEKDTPIAVKYKVFKNINTSALILKPQEIRHALNPGKPAEKIKLIAEKNWFINSLLISDNDKLRMLDRELVLRFLAFQIFNYTEYKPSIVEFLDNAMNYLYTIPMNRLQFFELKLEHIINTIFSAFNENCFSRSLFDNSRKYGHNNILFELLTYGFSLLTNEERNSFLMQGDVFKEKIILHFKNKDENFWEHENAYTQENLKRRFEEIELLFKKMAL